MESKRRGWGAILPATAFVTALFYNGCTEPREDPSPQPTHEQAVQQQISQIDDETPQLLVRNLRQPVPTTEEVVHVRGDEFEISGPYTHRNLELFLIHSSAQRKHKRKILTLSEALKQKKVRVHETGNVQELAIENLTDDTDIYVQSGDIVQGGKQDRVLAVDLLLQPKSGKMPLASFCVEQGRWSPRGAEFPNMVSAAGGQVPLEGAMGSSAVFRSSSNAVSSKALKKAVKLAKNQQDVWREVATMQNVLTKNIGADVRASLSASSLELTLNNKLLQKAAAEYQARLGKIVEGKKDVIGYAFAINGELNSADIYASNQLFAKLWDKMLQATAVEAVSVADAKKTETKPTATKAIQAFLTVDKNTKGRGQVVNARVQVVTVDGDKLVFSETRDKAANAAWLHRSYFAK